jgi:hypothetical protein
MRPATHAQHLRPVFGFARRLEMPGIGSRVSGHAPGPFEVRSLGIDGAQCPPVLAASCLETARIREYVKDELDYGSTAGRDHASPRHLRGPTSCLCLGASCERAHQCRVRGKPQQQDSSHHQSWHRSRSFVSCSRDLAARQHRAMSFRGRSFRAGAASIAAFRKAFQPVSPVSSAEHRSRQSTPIQKDGSA